MHGLENKWKEDTDIKDSLKIRLKNETRKNFNKCGINWLGLINTEERGVNVKNI